MEFTFDVGQVFPGIITVLETNANEYESSIRISTLDIESTQDEKQDTNSWIYQASANTPWDLKLKRKKDDLATIIDNMGYASAQAQGLRSPITTLKKFLNSTNQKIYVLRDTENSKAVVGFLKIGIKRLFVCDQVGAHHEVDPLCILDFYVHESKQRCGFGHELFNKMLQAENVTPEKLAVDRPSLKFLSFLTKHYNLKDPLVQGNNFVIYPGFFVNREAMHPVKRNCNNPGSYASEMYLFVYYEVFSKRKNTPQTATKKSFNERDYTYCNVDLSSQSFIICTAEALNSIKVPLSSDELKKNKTYYSSAARCLVWNDEEGCTGNRQYRNPNPSAPSHSTDSASTKNNNWPVNSAAYSCSSAHKKKESWGSNHSTPCALPPVNSISNYSQKQWDQLQSSWNILGVKPLDFSTSQKQN